MKGRIALFGAVVLLVAACSSSHNATGRSPISTPVESTSSSLATFSISGKITLYGEITTGTNSMRPGARCIGITNPDFPSEDYEDLAVGAEVTVKDADGHTAGLGHVTNSLMWTVFPVNSRVCEFDFTVPDIEAGLRFYRLVIAGHPTQLLPEDQFRAATDLSIKSAFYHR